jgi:hypothetical protein
MARSISKPISPPANGHGNETIRSVTRTSAGLRDALFDEIDGLRAGTSDGPRANAIARIAGEIVNTVHMEIAVQRYQVQTDKARRPILPESVNLGRVDEAGPEEEEKDAPPAAE